MELVLTWVLLSLQAEYSQVDQHRQVCGSADVVYIEETNRGKTIPMMSFVMLNLQHVKSSKKHATRCF